MAEAITKRKLTENEIDIFVAQYFAGNILTRVSEVIYIEAVQGSLQKNNNIEISTPEVNDSIKRLLKSDDLEIVVSNVSLLVTSGAGYGLRVSCDVELTQKRKVVLTPSRYDHGMEG